MLFILLNFEKGNISSKVNTLFSYLNIFFHTKRIIRLFKLFSKLSEYKIIITREKNVQKYPKVLIGAKKAGLVDEATSHIFMIILG